MDKTIYTVDIKKLEGFKGSLRDFAYIVYNEKRLNSETHKPNKLRVFVYDDGKEKSRLKSLLKKYGASEDYIKEVISSGKTETVKENMNTYTMDKKDAIFESAREVAMDLVVKYGQKTHITEDDIVETFSDAIEDVYRSEFSEIEPSEISWDSFYDMVNNRIEDTNDKGLSLESIDVLTTDDLMYLVYILTDEEDHTLFEVDDAIAASDYVFSSGEHYSDLTPELIPDCVTFYQGWEETSNSSENSQSQVAKAAAEADIKREYGDDYIDPEEVVDTNWIGESTVNEDDEPRRPYNGPVSLIQRSFNTYGVWVKGSDEKQSLVLLVDIKNKKFLYPDGRPIQDYKVLKVFDTNAAEDLVKQLNSVAEGIANVDTFKADNATEALDEGFCYVAIEDLVNESKKEARAELMQELEKSGRLVSEPVNEGRELPKPSKAPKGVKPSRADYRSYISADKKSISEDIAEIKTLIEEKTPIIKELSVAANEGDVKKLKELGGKIADAAKKKSNANRITKLVNHIVSCVENIINIKDILDSAKKATNEASVTANFAKGRKLFESDEDGDSNSEEGEGDNKSDDDKKDDNKDNNGEEGNKEDDKKNDEEEVIEGDRVKVIFEVAEGHDREEVIDAIKKDLDEAGIPEDGIEILDADDDKDDEIQVIVDGDYISELKDFCEKHDIDLEEKLGGDIEIDDEKDDKKDDDKKEDDGETSDDSGLFSGDMLDDIFGTDLDDTGSQDDNQQK